MGFSTLDFKSCIPYFQPREIVCLECDRSYLYAEVVQTVEERQLCWVHPLLLVIHSSVIETQADASEPTVYHDLRGEVDLLLPVVLFRSAFDTEVAPLLTHLYGPTPEAQSSSVDKTVQQRVNQLVKQICRSRPEAFRE